MERTPTVWSSPDICPNEQKAQQPALHREEYWRPREKVNPRVFASLSFSLQKKHLHRSDIVLFDISWNYSMHHKTKYITQFDNATDMQWCIHVVMDESRCLFKIENQNLFKNRNCYVLHTFGAAILSTGMLYAVAAPISRVRVSVLRCRGGSGIHA